MRSRGARGPEGELSQSGGRGSGRELLAWGHSEAAPRLLGNTSGRGAEREGGRARSCAATRGTAAHSAGKGARRWAGSAAPTSSAAGGGSRLLPLPWSRALHLRSQLPPPGPVVTRPGFKSSAGSDPQQQRGVRAQCPTARPEPGCECITQRERGCQEQVTWLIRAEGLTEKPRRWCCLPGRSLDGCSNVGAE